MMDITLLHFLKKITNRSIFGLETRSIPFLKGNLLRKHQATTKNSFTSITRTARIVFVIKMANLAVFSYKFLHMGVGKKRL